MVLRFINSGFLLSKGYPISWIVLLENDSIGVIIKHAKKEAYKVVFFPGFAKQPRQPVFSSLIDAKQYSARFAADERDLREQKNPVVQH